MLQFSVTLF